MKHRSELVAHSMRLMKDAVRAEEVVQDAFVKFILAAPELESSSHALAYLHRVIENSCIDIFRAEGRRPNLVLLDEATAEIEAKWQESKNLEDWVMAADDARIIRQALSLLSPAERAALIMWEIEGRSAQEIAVELGIKRSTVRHTLSRARSSFRKVLATVIIDEERGLTALDLLSSTSRFAGDIAKKSSKITLSLLLLFGSFLGFSAFVNPSVEKTEGKSELEVYSLPSTDLEDSSNQGMQLNGSNKEKVNNLQKESESKTKSKVTQLVFPGLNARGIPTGFTVTDLTGAVGDAYFRERSTSDGDSEYKSGQILKTRSGAANILMVQTLALESSEFSYAPIISYGRDGMWIPVSVMVSQSDFMRQKDGNYLFTAVMDVEFEIVSSIEVEASTEGRDLYGPPRQIVTRILLDESKLRVLAQSIFVIEKGTEA
jgi:RNA polymerase sigma factor (sigma-70 family)